MSPFLRPFLAAPVEQGEDPAKGVVRGNPIGQLQELLQPVPFGVSEFLHGDKVIGAGDHGTDGEEQDVAEVVALTALDAGVLQAIKVAKEGRRRGRVEAHSSSS